MSAYLNRLISVSLLLILSGCCSPDECKPAQVGFEIYQPIINALEKYKSDKGNYPANLQELTPSYLSEIPKPEGWRTPTPVEYEQYDDAYQLKFTYGGPGFNWCIYTPGLPWDCAGAF